MRRVVQAIVLAGAALVSCVPLVALIGLGIHRHASPPALVGAAMFLVYGPPLAVALAGRQRVALLATGLAGWALALFGLMPVYFPGERREAVATGLGVLGIGVDGLQALAERLPEEPTVASPEVAEATPVAVDVAPAAADPIGDDQMTLPYEGEGRRLSVPVIFGNGSTEVDLDMMFDTGATYTTLSHATLAKLGVHPGKSDPVIRLHTANGERDATVVLLDHVWLGDLQIDGVAIATCDDCAGTDVGGLLGLNVSGRFNVAIDADRREVVFTRRVSTDRKLDIKPFTDLSATFSRFPGGRVEVVMKLENRARREIADAVTSVRCSAGGSGSRESWTVDLGTVAAGERTETRRKLPQHEPCDEYEIALDRATW
jgi:clan AA aspartic protease (TIGR02281 family)